jgi:hypothetical protein
MSGDSVTSDQYTPLHWEGTGDETLFVGLCRRGNNARTRTLNI